MTSADAARASAMKPLGLGVVAVDDGVLAHALVGVGWSPRQAREEPVLGGP